MIAQVPDQTSVTVPTEALQHLEMSASDLELEVRIMLAARLYQKGLFSTGGAAELLDVPRVVLLNRLGDFDVDLVEMTPEELREEFENALRGCR